jgi:hypothetical protein
MNFCERLEYYDLLNRFAKHPNETDIIVAIASKEHKIAQRIIEYTQTGYAKTYNLVLPGGYDVRERFKFGPRKDVNCRGPPFPFNWRSTIYCMTFKQGNGLTSLVFGPLYDYINDDDRYEMIKNDLNHRRELIPQKKDISGIQRPQRQLPQPAAFWATRTSRWDHQDRRESAQCSPATVMAIEDIDTERNSDHGQP